MLKIHGVPFSAHTRKVIIAAVEKGIPYEIVPVIPLTPPPGWTEHSFDAVNCEVTIVVPPRTAVWIGDRDSCGALRGGAATPEWPALFQLLRVETSGGVVEFSKWEAARAFEFVRHFFSPNVCRFDFQ